MQQLNAKSTRIFCALMDSLDQGYLKIINKPYMPLTMECIGTAMLPPFGIARLFSLCHYYKQNGDLMQDPEMCFAVVDERKEPKEYAQVAIVPYMFRQANLGIDQESMQLGEDRFTSFDMPRQREHADFANDWLENIQEQGFLAALASGNIRKPGEHRRGDDTDDE